MIASALPARIRIGIVAVLAGAALVSVVSASAAAQVLRPSVTSRHSTARARQAAASSAPIGRAWAAFAYDPALSEFVLFGGSSRVVFGDTWILKDGKWSQEHPAHAPSPRTGAAMVYDAATSQLLLFGGSTGGEAGFRAQTWVWTGASWRRLHPATSPPIRHNADMVYDAATHDVILFGGYDGHYLGDTWSWNGTTWTRLAPRHSPSPRDSESMAYDQATGTAILFGGYSRSTGRLGDTWSWNGTTWTKLAPAHSPGVITIAWQAAYDAATRQVLLFGGDLGFGIPQNLTWAWNGTTWTRLSPATSPDGRAYGSMAYDGTTGHIILVGGYTDRAATNFPSTTWRWDGTTWQRAR